MSHRTNSPTLIYHIEGICLFNLTWKIFSLFNGLALTQVRKLLPPNNILRTLFVHKSRGPSRASKLSPLKAAGKRHGHNEWRLHFHNCGLVLHIKPFSAYKLQAQMCTFTDSSARKHYQVSTAADNFVLKRFGNLTATVNGEP